MKEKTKRITTWYELLEFVEGINPNKETIVLSGYVNRLFGDRCYIDTLYFTTKPVQVLKGDKNGKNSTGKKIKRTKTSTVCSEEDTEDVSKSD